MAVRQPFLLLPRTVARRSFRHFLNDCGRNACLNQRMLVREGCTQLGGRRTIGDAPGAE